MDPMGWSFHKSLNFGGLRLNLSKSGIGASMGIRGLRYGISPNGRQYVRCGMGGVYYQKTLSPGLGGGSPSHRPVPTHPHSGPHTNSTTGPERLIRSAAAGVIVDSTSADFIREVQQRLKTPQWHVLSLAGGFAVLLIGAALQITLIAICGAVLMLGGGMAGYMVYRAKRTTEIHYDLDDHYGRRYSELLAGFEHLRRSQRIWSVETTAAVYNAKYHAGASSVLTRKGVTAAVGNPYFLRVNMSLPMLRTRSQSLYFLPDMLLVVQGRNVGERCRMPIFTLPQMPRNLSKTNFPRAIRNRLERRGAT